MKQRIVYIDLLRAIGILLVILGHVYNYKEGELYRAIYSFHMPLFFFISGIFFSYRYTTKEFLSKRIRSLITPYFFFYIVTFLYWIIIERNIRAASGGVEAEWWKPLLGLFYQNNAWDMFAHNNAIWFVPALFSIEITCLFLNHHVDKRLIPLIGILFVAAAIVCDKKGIVLPLGGNRALYNFIFYWIGTQWLFIKNSLTNTSICSCKKIFTVIFSIVLLYIYIMYVYGNYGGFIYTGSLCEIGCKYVLAVYMIFTCILLCKSISYLKIKAGDKGIFCVHRE